jgi:hypothetical protein
LSNPQRNHGRAIDMFLWPARTPLVAVIQRHNYCLLWRKPPQDMQHAAAIRTMTPRTQKSCVWSTSAVSNTRPPQPQSAALQLLELRV